jgi:hypothetical protein
MRTSTQKGDIAIMEAATDLTKKGYTVLRPTTAEDLGYDLVIEKEGRFLRVQVKFSRTGILYRTRRAGKERRPYNELDADLFAIYLPEPDAVVYVPINFKGFQIRWTLPNTGGKFWWYGDLLAISEEHPKQRTARELKKTHQIRRAKHTRKSTLPDKEELRELVWKMPLTQVGVIYEVSDNAIRKRAKKLGIKLPKQGFWAKAKNRKHIGRSPSGYGT